MGRYVEDPLDPDHVVDLDEVDAIARMRAERALAAMPIDEERRAALQALEAEAPEPAPAPAAPRRRSAAPIVLALYALGMPFALLVRVLTIPWREALRARARRAADRARVRVIERARALATAAADTPEALNARGLAWLEAGDALRAELAFDASVRAAETTNARAALAAALQNRGIARARLGFRKLGAADARRRAALDVPLRTPLSVTLVEILQLLRIGLRVLAGLDED